MRATWAAAPAPWRARAIVLLFVLAVGACSTLPPGARYPKQQSTAFAHPEQTRLGLEFADTEAEHGTQSGFRLVPRGADGFLIRMEMIRSAERALDLQYYIFNADDTGTLLTGAVLQAADRGVRVRILIDDADSTAGDERVQVLAAHPAIELRIFNPFRYRGHSSALRGLEFLFDAQRLDYRMHNKLMVVDNAVALVGGRNIGDEYFQMNPKIQFADDDVFVAGPAVQQLSKYFDQFWNSDMAIPAQALSRGVLSEAALHKVRQAVDQRTQSALAGGLDAMRRLSSGEPLADIVSHRLSLVWANAEVLCDSPDKKEVNEGKMVGNLMRREVAAAIAQVHSELLMVTPYFVPGKDGMRLIEEVRRHGARVRVLTNSLVSSVELMAQAGYTHYRRALLEDGVELYELRALLGNTRGSGEPRSIAAYGNYSLHAKLFVFDRERVFIGSMNFDQRSIHLNTEIGLIIDSPELAQQSAQRFAAMVELENAFRVELVEHDHDEPQLRWITRIDGQPVEYRREPARSGWQRFQVHMFALLPADDEL